jgi:hypothetical protein
MILVNNKLMLLYGFSDDERAFYDKMIKELDLPSYKIISPSMANMKIRDILDGLKIDTYNRDLPDEKVVLFNNFSDYELDMAIRTIRSNKQVRPILAIVTQTSIDWEFHKLIDHLIEEREQARKYMQQKTE